jgi:hypothetical protein
VILWRLIWRGLAAAVGLAVIAVAIVVFAPQTAKAVLEKAGGEGTTVAGFLPPTLPEASEVREAHWLDQSWSDRERFWFHHTSQGTATLPVPYDWFLELESPELAPFGAPARLADTAYLKRYGFIPSPSLPKGLAPDAATEVERYRISGYPDNRDGLPVGFARMEPGSDPTTRAKHPALIGLTCAGCHTGHLEYKNVSIRFDGGPAMTNLVKLEEAVVLAVLYTLEVPGRFDRFAARLAARNRDWPAWQDKAKLHQEMQEALNRFVVIGRWVRQSSATPPVKEGFGRLDALNRAGNLVFFNSFLPNDIITKDPKDPATQHVPSALAANFVPVRAPVSFPPLWDAPTFLWAQYDASIFNALVRNAGEALGAGARVDMIGADPARRFDSSLRLANIAEMEKLIAGSDPFTYNRRSFDGLAAPRWSDAARIFPGDPNWTLNAAKVERGREVYRAFCVGCHRGPVRDATFDRLWPDYSFWSEKSPDRRDPNWIKVGGRSFFNVVEIPVTEIGTDPGQSRILTERTVALPPALDFNPVKVLDERGECGLGKRNDFDKVFGIALMAVVGSAVDKWFADNPTGSVAEKAMRGPRANCPNDRTFTESDRIVTHYKARPLDGVWATAPYLHNGSVPTLHALLTPQNERPKLFCVGSRQFDPKNVGLPLDPLSCAIGLTTFDATEPGSSNLGHSFEGTETDRAKRPPGVIGRALTADERDDLIEYLKTL